MKLLPALYRSIVLIGPLLVIAALIAGPFGCGSSSSGPAALPTFGSLEVGFVDSPSQAFQSLSPNIIEVRLNPTTNPDVLDTDPNWVTVSAPPGVTLGEVAVNLLDVQNSAVIFNTGDIPAQVYNQIELVIDASTPGIVIPSCASSTSPPLEGCITFNTTISGTTNLRFNAAPSGGLPVTALGLTPMILDINPGAITAPASALGNYTMNPSITLVPTANFLTTISGTVSGVLSTSADKINAELTGTNTVIATAPVQSSGAYTIQLPANPAPGTTYDLFVSGATTFDAAPGLTVVRGGAALTQNFSVSSSVAAGSVSGQVIDARTKGALVGATVNLLLQTSTSDNCVAVSPNGCVVVATTTTNNTGSYVFAVNNPPGSLKYYAQASMAGTNTVTELVSFATVSICSAGPNPANCSFLMPNVLLNGQIVVDPAPAIGTNTVVTVIAEQTGTGNLVGLTQVTVPRTGTAPFAMEVPQNGTPNNFVDLIASANDAYLGISTEFPGHQIAVASNVNPATTSATPVTLTVACLGHGTVSGLAPLPDFNTHVLLFEDNVQLMDSTVGPTSSTLFPAQYSFCAPPNTYTVQRVEELGKVITPVGSPQPVIVPVPAPTATSACPLCVNSAGQCPGNCSATAASALNP